MAGGNSHFRTAVRTRVSGAMANVMGSVCACGGKCVTRVNASVID